MGSIGKDVEVTGVDLNPSTIVTSGIVIVAVNASEKILTWGDYVNDTWGSVAALTW